MTKANTESAAKAQLRLKLIGKPLVGFDTTSWHTVAVDGAIKGRVGNKAGIKGAPSRA